MSDEHSSSERWLDKFLGQFFMDWRVLSFLLAVVIVSSFVFFIAIRMRATYLIENEAALHTQQLIDLRKELAECREQGQKDISDLVATIYGPANKQRRPSIAEGWQKNRDKEIRDRIHNLEQWRYRTEKQK